MQPAPRFATGGKVSFAPVGTPLSDKSAWTELPVRDCAIWFDESAEWHVSDLQPHFDAIDKAVANMAAAEYGGFRQRFMAGSLPVTINERSKPVGLTKEYEYRNDADGRKLSIEKSADDHRSAYIHVTNGSDGVGIWLDYADTVPLALNVLGHDRPGILGDINAKVGDVVVRGYPYCNDVDRDGALARVIANLKSIDRYDQRKAEREANEAAAQAKADAEYARHKQESFDRAKVTYADAIRDQIAVGINAESVAKVQAALSAYETARRKLEGLPS